MGPGLRFVGPGQSSWGTLVETNVAESEVKHPIPTRPFPKFPTPVFQISDSQLRPFQNFPHQTPTPQHKRDEIWLIEWISWYTGRNLCFNKSFKINSIISTGIPNLGMWCKKWFNWTSGVGAEQNSRLRLRVLSGIWLHWKTSDTATLVETVQNWKLLRTHVIINTLNLFRKDYPTFFAWKTKKSTIMAKILQSKFQNFAKMRLVDSGMGSRIIGDT